MLLDERDAGRSSLSAQLFLDGIYIVVLFSCLHTYTAVLE
jgi:hypothetical protein